MNTTTKYTLEPANISKLPDWQQEKYDAHLQAWFNDNQPSGEMIYKHGYNNQCMFIRDHFAILFFNILKKIEVISTHTSKSIKLPVYHIVMNGVELIMRHNFHDWKVSVISNQALDFPIELFSNPDRQITYHYCEGFDKDWIFAPYVENKQQFTVEMHNSNLLYVFLFLLKLQLEKSKFYK